MVRVKMDCDEMVCARLGEPQRAGLRNHYVLILMLLQFCISICVSSVSTNLGKHSVRYKASKFWNSFLDSLKVIGTSKQFKNKLKFICSQQLFPVNYVNCSCCIVCFAAE